MATLATPVLTSTKVRTRPRVVIVGGGFGGIHAALGLAKSAVDITLIDRKNYHTFQPLLYQVALAVLSPGDIAQPIRSIVREHKNIDVLMDEVVAIDTAAQRVTLKGGPRIEYDYLILATGSTHSYFGHNDWAALAPGLKTVEDATEIRRRVLLAFELAERQMLETGKHPALNFVVIGGGPTGVELAGAISDIARLYGKRLPAYRSFVGAGADSGGRPADTDRLSGGPAGNGAEAAERAGRPGPRERARHRRAAGICESGRGADRRGGDAMGGGGAGVAAGQGARGRDGQAGMRDRG